LSFLPSGGTPFFLLGHRSVVGPQLSVRIFQRRVCVSFPLGVDSRIFPPSSRRSSLPNVFPLSLFLVAPDSPWGYVFLAEVLSSPQVDGTDPPFFFSKVPFLLKGGRPSSPPRESPPPPSPSPSVKTEKGRFDRFPLAPPFLPVPYKGTTFL